MFAGRYAFSESERKDNTLHEAQEEKESKLPVLVLASQKVCTFGLTNSQSQKAKNTNLVQLLGEEHVGKIKAGNVLLISVNYNNKDEKDMSDLELGLVDEDELTGKDTADIKIRYYASSNGINGRFYQCTK